MKLLLLLSICSLSIAYAQKDDITWTLRKDDKGVKVATNFIDGSEFFSMKATCAVNRKLEDVLLFFGKVEDYPKWQSDMLYAKLVDTSKQLLRDKASLEYNEIYLPWPYKNRDIVAEKTLKQTNDVCWEVAYLSKPDAYPISEDNVRVKSTKGVWTFCDDNGSTTIEHTNTTKNETGIPNWIVEMFIVDGPFKTLVNLKESLES